MSKFMFLYLGPFGGVASKPPLTQAALSQWAQQAGAVVVDRGTLFSPYGQTMVDTGVPEEAPFPMHGYSIVEAEDIEAAMELTKGHPFLAGGKDGMYEIEVQELLTGEMPAEAFGPETAKPYSWYKPAAPGPQPLTSPAAPLPPSQSPIVQPATPSIPSTPLGPSTIQPNTPPAAPGELNISHDEPTNNPPVNPNPPNPV